MSVKVQEGSEAYYQLERRGYLVVKLLPNQQVLMNKLSSERRMLKCCSKCS